MLHLFPSQAIRLLWGWRRDFTNDSALAEKMKSIRIHGSKDKYDNIRIGINGRLDTFQAAILLEKLNIFPEEVKKRNQKAMIY